MYTPKLKKELVQRLYLICLELDIPMTAFVNGALERLGPQAERYLIRGEKWEVLGMMGAEREEDRSEPKPRPAAAGG